MSSSMSTGVPSGAAWVYRLFGVDGQLLYVGESVNPRNRFYQHRRTAWWQRVVRSEITQYASKQLAVLAEKQALETEAPEMNSVGTEINRLSSDEAHRLVGVSRSTLADLYGNGRPSSLTFDARSVIDARLLDLSRAGHNMTALARGLGWPIEKQRGRGSTSCRKMQRALHRARLAEAAA